MQIVRQRPLIGSALLADTVSAAAPLVFDRRGDTHFEACMGLPRAPYLIAVASDQEQPALPPSVYVDRSDLDTCEQARRSLDEHLRQHQAKLAESQLRVAQLAQALAASEQALAESERAFAASRQQSEALQQRHDVLRGSLRTFLRGYLPLLRRNLFARKL
ncbi:MAG TPA: hypothetical protein VFL55_15395 [Acetobacteraceae bacterium]|nr:hypothetical protein [Acetobacteraceae bacterium]